MEWFAPLYYGDKDAAQLRVTGQLVPGGGERMKVETVEELRNGERRPPITEDDIRRACGKSLLNGLESYRKGASLTMTLDRNADWSIGFRELTDDGWGRSSDEEDD